MDWSLATLPVTIPNNREIHVWKFDLNCDLDTISYLKERLSNDEDVRANRFRFEHDRNFYIASRGILRLLLGMYLNESPQQLQFEYGKQGKPALADSQFASLNFNVSHSNNLVLLAFGWERDIGVDVEWVSDRTDWEGIAQRFFSIGEQQALHYVPREQRKQAFFDCWTRKEAYIKALGGGLSVPLGQFEVTLAPGEPARLLKSEGQVVSDWSMRAIDCAQGYAAAVVARGPMFDVRRLAIPLDRLLAFGVGDLFRDR